MTDLFKSVAEIIRESLPSVPRPMPTDVSRTALGIPSPRMVRAYINSRVKNRYRGVHTGQVALRDSVLRKTGGTCYLCGKIYDPDKARYFPHLFFANLEIDHVVPVDSFGINAEVNYMPSCRSCNKQKSNISLMDYRNGWRRRRDGVLYKRNKDV